jgi:hypothetical protein
MNTLERHSVERYVPPARAHEAQTPTTASEDGDAFLRAADAALDRALSVRPDEFLRQNRQLGGE